MIRRKMWATMTCCLALAGVARSEGEPTAKASLGKPQTAPGVAGIVARGAAPTETVGYPANYPIPGPTYSVPTPSLGGVPVYLPTMSSPRFAPAPNMPQYVAPGANPVGFASMQAPVAAPMQMPLNTNPMGAAPMGAVPTGPSPSPMGAPPAITTQPMQGGPGTYGYGQPTGEYVNSPMTGMIPGVMDAGNALPCVWVAPEYINWRAKGSNTPALVTTAPAGTQGTLGQPGTRVLFGGNELLDDWRSGFRIRGGVWLDKCEGLGLDFGYIMLAQGRQRFNASSNGDPGLFRPFRTPAGAEDSQLVAFNDTQLGPILSGRVAINATTDLMGAEANIRKALFCDPCSRLDVLFGFRYMRLRDSLTVFEDLRATSNDPNAAAPFGTRIQIYDSFETINDFYGGQLGLAGEQRYGNFIFGFRGTLGMGITHRTTRINGSTTTLTPDGASATSQGGLLALPTNIGVYNSDHFSVIPDVQLTLGYQVTKNLRIFGGYNFMYWTSVLRAGEQIDRTVNSTFIPNPGGDAGTGALRPAYSRHEASYWAHGWSAGLEFRW